MLAMAVGTLLVPALAGRRAASGEERGGYVYVLNNPAGTNSITSLLACGDGSLMLGATTMISGTGTGASLASQGSLVASPDHRWLFAVDAGSNQISVVKVKGDGTLSPAGVYPSGGVDPVSLTYTRGWLYVVNAGDATHAGNVDGFNVSPMGMLTWIPGSMQPFSAASVGPAEVSASADGKMVVVTEKATNQIDSYVVKNDGSLTTPMFITSTGTTPYGFAWSPTMNNEFITSDAEGGAAGATALTPYMASMTGTVTALSSPVPDFQTAACWVVITNDGRYVYTTNAHSGTISSYAINRNGTITFLMTVYTGGVPTEMALTPDSQYFYTLEVGTGGIFGYRVEGDGGFGPSHGPGRHLDSHERRGAGRRLRRRWRRRHCGRRMGTSIGAGTSKTGACRPCRLCGAPRHPARHRRGTAQQMGRRRLLARYAQLLEPHDGRPEVRAFVGRLERVARVAQRREHVAADRSALDGTALTADQFVAQLDLGHEAARDVVRAERREVGDLVDRPGAAQLLGGRCAGRDDDIPNRPVGAMLR